MRYRIYLLIIQNVTAFGFSGFYRLPQQLREHLTAFKPSMSTEELLFSWLNGDAAIAGSWGRGLEFAVAPGCFRLHLLQEHHCEP